MKHLFFSLFLAVIMILQPASAKAQMNNYLSDTDSYFEKYTHESGLFRLLMPIGHKTETKTMRMDEKIKVYSSVVKTVNDNRPIHNSVKTYQVILNQTLGPAIRDADLPLFLDNDVKRYIHTYEDRLGYLSKEERQVFGKRAGTELIIMYEDPELGKQGLRARIMYSDYSKLEAIFTGPPDVLFSNQTNKFFQSIDFFNGRIKDEGQFVKEWRPYMPPSQIYTTYLPPLTEPFFPLEPIVKEGDRVELISTRFLDPVWNQYLFYNVHTYRFKAPIDSGNAKKIIYDRHLKKFDVNIHRITYKTVMTRNEEYFETASEIYPPPGFDYLDLLMVRGRIHDNVLVVQELMGPQQLANTYFGSIILNLMDFHPLGPGKETPVGSNAIPDFITGTQKIEDKKTEESLTDILGVE